MKIELGVTEEEYMYIESVILLMQDCNEKLIKKSEQTPLCEYEANNLEMGLQIEGLLRRINVLCENQTIIDNR